MIIKRIDNVNIVAYCRVSTNKDDQLNSLETQKEFFEEFAEKYNHNLIKIYADEGITGTQLKKRKQFQKLMNDANHGLFEMVVVKDISRFARNAVDFLQGIRYLKQKGIACNFVNANLSTQDSEMILGTLALVAQEESANTSKRIKFSKKLNAEKGRVPNIVYGYDKKIGDYFNLSINEFEAEVVKRMYRLYVHEGYGANKIAQILNNDGLKTKRGCRWSQNAVARILSNPIYTGKIINGKQEIRDFLTGERTEKDEEDWLVTDRQDLRIIEPELFELTQNTLNKRKKAFDITRQRQSNKYIFSTLIKCKNCGYSFRRFKYQYKNTYIRWGCSGRNANGVDYCNNKTVIDEQELIDSIKDYFRDMVLDRDSLIKNIVNNFHKQYKSEDENIKTEKELTMQLNKLKKKKSKSMEMFENDVIDIKELKEKTTNVNEQIEKVENKLKLIDYNLSKGDKLEEILNKTFKDIEDIISMDNMTNTMLKRIIDRIVVDDEGNVDIYLKLFSDIGLDNSILFRYDRT